MTSLVVNHKKLIIMTIVITVVGIQFGRAAMALRSRLLAQLTAPKQSQSGKIYYATGSAHAESSLPIPTHDTSDVLGSSSDPIPQTNDTDYIATIPTLIPMPTDYPAPTLMPIPTFAPIPTSTPPLNCAGTANVDKSQVYVSSNSVQVGSTSTITVELRDCNNNLASNDSLRISLQNSDATAKVNGQSPSVTIQAQNGKATFTVASQTAGTDTFLITDTNQNFPVTMPGYRNPSVTFTNNTSGNSNCTTPGGTPNTWYSDVYPNPPVSTTTGSQEMQVVIRDCNKNEVSNDTVKITITGGDTNAKINGSSSPYSFSVQNGKGNFTVTSQVAGTVTLSVQDTTNSFTITDTNNHNPSISFSFPASSTPTPTAGPTNSPTPTSGPTPAATDTPGITPTPTSAPTPTGTTSTQQ